MQTVQSIAFDFSVHGITPRIVGKQGDVGSRVVQISLYDQGIAWPIPDGALLALRYKLPSGASGLYDKIDNASALTADHNTVSALLAAPIFAESGATFCELVITDATGGISTWAFAVLVEAASASDEDIPEDYYNAFLGVAAQAAEAVAEAERQAARAEAAASSIDTSNLCSKTMYDPTGAVEAAGGIPKYVEANTAKGGFIETSEKGVASGVVPLNTSAKIDGTYLYKSTSENYDSDTYLATSSAVKKVYDLVKSETGTGTISSVAGASSHTLSATYRKIGKLIAINFTGSVSFTAQSSSRQLVVRGTITGQSLTNAWGVGWGSSDSTTTVSLGTASDGSFVITVNATSFTQAQAYSCYFRVLFMLP